MYAVFNDTVTYNLSCTGSSGTTHRINTMLSNTCSINLTKQLWLANHNIEVNTKQCHVSTWSYRDLKITTEKVYYVFLDYSQNYAFENILKVNRWSVPKFRKCIHHRNIYFTCIIRFIMVVTLNTTAMVLHRKLLATKLLIIILFNIGYCIFSKDNYFQ